MAIEFPTGPQTGAMSISSSRQLAEPGHRTVRHPGCGCAFQVNVKWEIPAPHNMTLGGTFQLRAYVGIGPGQEQLGATQIVPGRSGATAYAHDFVIPGGTLLGEGQLFGGAPVSGRLQDRLRAATPQPRPTWISGYAEESLRMFLSRSRSLRDD